MTTLTQNGLIGKQEKFSSLEADNIKCDALGHKALVITTAANRTLLASESGAIVNVNAAVAHTITLPAASPGMRYTFCLTADAVGAVVIAANAADDFKGVICEGTSNVITGDAAASIAFAAGQTVGATIEIFCSLATVWNVRAFSKTASKFTLA